MGVLLEDLTEDETKVLLNMSSGEIVYPIAQIAADSNVGIKETRHIVRAFTNNGIAEFGYLKILDEDLLAGRGYWLSEHGKDLREELEWRSNCTNT